MQKLDPEQLRRVLGAFYADNAEPDSPEFWNIVQSNIVHAKGYDGPLLRLVRLLKQSSFSRYFKQALLGYVAGMALVFVVEITAREARSQVPDWFSPLTTLVPLALLVEVINEWRTRSQLKKLLSPPAA